jgi:predicted 3-demethylubiquinone-9 3-methyltransferase (glyoxalase superfamily)
MALNGGPMFKFNESVSLVVNCDNQEEIDYFWDKLTSGGGQESMCGWLKDKFGLSWQIVPAELGKLMSDKEPGKAQRVMAALLQMKKLDLNVLRNA